MPPAKKPAKKVAKKPAAGKKVKKVKDPKCAAASVKKKTRTR